MQKSKKTDVCISERDIKLFRYLFSHKGARAQQIKRDIFVSASIKYVYRRLKKLESFGFLKAQTYKIKRHSVCVYYITRKALSSAFDVDEELQRQELKSTNLEHDCTLVDIMWMFQKAECLDLYATENELEAGLLIEDNYPVDACKALHSDALLGLYWDDEHVDYAIEYENSTKGSSRYLNVLKSYYSYPQINFVLFIVKEEQSKKRLFAADRRFLKEQEGEESKIFVVTLSELKEPFTEMKAYNTNKEFIGFKFREEICL